MKTSESNQIKIALIGYGYWGKKLYKNLLNILPKINILIVDPTININEQKHQSTTLKQILENNEISHVLISTPEETHFSIAKQCLQNNKHIFVEKPFCLKQKEAIFLQQLANKNNLKVFVDYIFLYDPYIKKIKYMIDNGKIGKLLHIQSTRHSININKPKISVFDDLATHDIYLGKYFFEKKCTKIKSISETISLQQITQGYVTYYYNDQTLSAQYSWIQPKVTRTMNFIGTKKSISWEKENSKIQIFEKQKLVEEIGITTPKISPIEKSIRNFLLKTSDNKNYENDIKILESLRINT